MNKLGVTFPCYFLLNENGQLHVTAERVAFLLVREKSGEFSDSIHPSLMEMGHRPVKDEKALLAFLEAHRAEFEVAKEDDEEWIIEIAGKEPPQRLTYDELILLLQSSQP